MHYRRRFLYLAIAVSIISFWCIGSNVFAQDVSPAPIVTNNDNIFETAYEVLGVALNFIYIVTLPLLAIAGKAMDNSMVYGEFLNLDKALYMLRNMSRTFANFAIGGYFLYHTFMFFFKPESDWKDIKKIIIGGAGAILGINFSRFILGALFDLSTILIYSLGSMPLSIIGQVQTAEENLPIVSIHTFLNYESETTTDTNTEKRIHNGLYYERNGWNISPCGDQGNIYKGFVLGPKYSGIIPGTDKNLVTLENNIPIYCARTPMDLVEITELEKRKKEKLVQLVTGNITTGVNMQYNNLIMQIVDQVENATGCNAVMITGVITNIGGTISSQDLIGTDRDKGLLQILPYAGDSKTLTYCNKAIALNSVYTNNKRREKFLGTSGNNNAYSNPDGMSTKSLLSKSQGMVGPFVTLYVTLLDFSNMSAQGADNQSTLAGSVGGITEFLIRGVFGVLLLAPLATLAVVLLMRVGLLWGLIAFIPLGIVLYAIKGEKSGGFKIIGEAEINPGSIIGLIFAPVVPVFVLSIGIILLQSLQSKMLTDIGSGQEARSFLGVQSTLQTDLNKRCLNFRNMQELCYKVDDNVAIESVFIDLFPWIFVNIFAIVILRFLVKASFAASPLTKEVSDRIMGFGETLLGSVPLVKIGGVGMGANVLRGAPDKALDALNKRVGDFDKEGEEALNLLTRRLAGEDIPTEGGNEGYKLKETSKTKTKTLIENVIKDSSNTAKIETIQSQIQQSNIESKDKEHLTSALKQDNIDNITQVINQIGLDQGHKDTYLKSLIENKYIHKDSGKTSIQTGKEEEFINAINNTDAKTSLGGDNAIESIIKDLTRVKDSKKYKIQKNSEGTYERKEEPSSS